MTSGQSVWLNVAVFFAKRVWDYIFIGYKFLGNLGMFFTSSVRLGGGDLSYTGLVVLSTGLFP